jgi:hypothetical protein
MKDDSSDGPVLPKSRSQLWMCCFCSETLPTVLPKRLISRLHDFFLARAPTYILSMLASDIRSKSDLQAVHFAALLESRQVQRHALLCSYQKKRKVSSVSKGQKNSHRRVYMRRPLGTATI